MSLVEATAIANWGSAACFSIASAPAISLQHCNIALFVFNQANIVAGQNFFINGAPDWTE